MARAALRDPHSCGDLFSTQPLISLLPMEHVPNNSLTFQITFQNSHSLGADV